MRSIVSVFFLLCLAVTAGCSGCSNERYTCDTTGCFTCDGIGCRREHPPARPDCYGHYQCGADERCTADGCIDTCSVDADCPRGTVCHASGLCLAPTETPPADQDGACVRDADCPSPPAAICVNGTCELDPDPCGASSCACDANDDCESGFVCVAGECTASDDACRFNDECALGYVCADGRCLAACGGALACASGSTCVDGACEPDPLPTGQCSAAMPCPTQQICIDSTCLPGCVDDGDCPAGDMCVANACVLDTRPKPFCTSNAQCAMGRICLGGVCRTPCDVDVECQMVSGTLPYCRDDVCVTSNQANSDCATSVDCGPSGACVDGVCR